MVTSGAASSSQRYLPYGGQRGTAEVATDRRYTGQRWQAQFGLYDYNARWYDPGLRRFVQPDSVVPEPGKPQSLNRYAYCLNNPVNSVDPTGHWLETAFDVAGILYDIYDIQHNGLSWETGLALGVDVACLLLPVATGGGLAVRAATHADDVADVARVANRADDAIDAVRVVDRVDDAADVTRATKLRSLTKANFRENLMRFTNQTRDSVKSLEPHHVLPSRLEPQFKKAGISNIHDPVFGSWVDPSFHKKWSYEYNKRWEKFLIETNPSPTDILNFARDLAKEYGFDVAF